MYGRIYPCILSADGCSVPSFVYRSGCSYPLCVTGFYSGNALLFAQLVVFGEMGYLKIAPGLKMEAYMVGALFAVMGIWRHKANIGRLLTGTENKFSLVNQEILRRSEEITDG